MWILKSLQRTRLWKLCSRPFVSFLSTSFRTSTISANQQKIVWNATNSTNDLRPWQGWGGVGAIKLQTFYVKKLIFFAPSSLVFLNHPIHFFLKYMDRLCLKCKSLISKHTIYCQSPNLTSTQGWVWQYNDSANPTPPTETQCQQYLSCYWPDIDETLKV